MRHIAFAVKPAYNCCMEEKDKLRPMTVRIPIELKRLILQRAAIEDRTVQSVVTAILWKGFKQ
jgi:hypothetical protein